MIRRLAAAAAVGGLLALPGVARAQTWEPSPASQDSVCTPNTNVCFNQYASTQERDGTYVIRANVNERSITFGALAPRRAILIFTHRYDPDTRTYVQTLVAQAPFCWQADCYVEFRTTNRSEAQLAYWWGATLNDRNHVLIARAGFPSS